MADRGRRLRELWGIRFVLVALVLGFLWSLLYFPVWSDSGLSMVIVLSFVTVQPLQFVLERVGPTAWIIGGLAVYLLESGRFERPEPSERLWNRERLAILFAIGAVTVLIAFLNSNAVTSFTSSFLLYATTGIIVLISLGLYLLWTAERIAGASMRNLGFVAFAFGLVAETLHVLDLGMLFGAIGPTATVYPPVSVASALLGAGSLAIWILTYSLILRGGRLLTRAVGPVAGA